MEESLSCHKNKKRLFQVTQKNTEDQENELEIVAAASETNVHPAVAAVSSEVDVFTLKTEHKTAVAFFFFGGTVFNV